MDQFWDNEPLVRLLMILGLRQLSEGAHSANLIEVTGKSVVDINTLMEKTDNPLVNHFMDMKVYAWGAYPYIKYALLKRAEVAIHYETEDGRNWMLSHGRMLRPAANIPWPLSLIEAHSITYSEYKIEGIGKFKYSENALYSRSQIDVGVARLLSRIPEDAVITIRVDEQEASGSKLLAPMIGLYTTIAYFINSVSPYFVAIWFLTSGAWSTLGFLAVSVAAALIGTGLVWAPYRQVITTSPFRLMMRRCLIVVPLGFSALVQFVFMQNAGDFMAGQRPALMAAFCAFIAALPLNYFARVFKQNLPTMGAYHGTLWTVLISTLVMFGSDNSYFEILAIHALGVLLALGVARLIDDMYPYVRPNQKDAAKGA